MKKLLFILFAFVSLNGYCQTVVVRTLDNVNNTADSLKPVSKPQKAALALKQNLLSGTGLLRLAGENISYDATPYLTVVPAQTFVSLIAKPTTISGYGITDFNALGDARYSLLAHSHLFSAITSKPTTLSGYGITDAYPLTGNPSGYTTLSAVSTVYAPIASPVHTGDIETTTLNSGVIVKSPNGTRFRLTVSNTGDIVATSL